MTRPSSLQARTPDLNDNKEPGANDNKESAQDPRSCPAAEAAEQPGYCPTEEARARWQQGARWAPKRAWRWVALGAGLVVVAARHPSSLLAALPPTRAFLSPPCRRWFGGLGRLAQG
jgi:hypothetical protein